MSEETRWAAEQQFFDNEEHQEGRIPESTIRRYTLCAKPWLPAEFNFATLGDVEGKHILELGCGDGGNAILLALRGAEVVGVDISPRAIGIARQRAELHGVAGRATFECTPIELFRPASGRKFDIVAGWAVLHHLIPVLGSTMSAVCEHARPGTLFVFAEPISLWRWLRRVRLLLPISLHGTPEERPLEPLEIAVIRKYMPGMKMQYHGGILRIVNRFVMRGRYEDLSRGARLMYDALARVDSFCLNRLGLSGLASTATMYGRLR